MFWIRIVLFAILNRARGTRLYNHTSSTIVGRMVVMFGMAITLAPDWLAVAWVFVTLVLWCTPAWDKYWSEAIGHSTTHSRLYGLMQMTIRQALILPCFLGLAYLTGASALWAGMFLLLGLPYYIMGFTKSNNQIGLSEYAVGAIIGLTVGLLNVG